MTEEIMKECKNCDALGIDSEIGVYYCCLSHRQDDLPKEFVCDDYTPNKQLKRLEQENKVLKSNTNVLNDYIIKNEQLKTNIDSLVKINESLKQENKELKDNNNHLQAIIDDGRAENKRFREENKELKNKNICRETCEYFKRICNENTLLIKYRSALEEIRTYLNTLSSIDNDFPNTETYLRIQDKINEVLGE